MGHTPGPWEWFDIKSSSAGVREPEGIPYLARTGTAEALILYGEDSLQVLSIDVKNPSSFPKPADARLIMAAPELLDALKRLVSYSELVLQQFHGYDCGDLINAKKAISAAEDGPQ
jgi:hypothetical protein